MNQDSRPESDTSGKKAKHEPVKAKQKPKSLNVSLQRLNKSLKN